MGYDALGAALSNADVKLDVAGVSLHGQGAMQRVPLDTSAMSDVGLLVIVPDEVVERLRDNGLPVVSYLNVMYREDRMQGDAALAAVLAEASPLPDGAGTLADGLDYCFRKTPWPVTNVYSGRSMADQASGLRMVIAFLALYIGFVMLVATAAVLAIQQLSETADSLGRYRRLSDLGCEMRQIFGSLRTQIVLYFCAPLVLAASHTVCAVTVVGATLFSELGVDPTGLIGIAAGSIVGVYAAYLIVTYLISKGIVRGSVLRREAV